MKRFDKIKTLQLALLAVLAASALIAVLRDEKLYALIGTNAGARTLSIILWATLGISFLFLLYDFNSYADMRRENLELDNAVYSDALTGLANRYSVDNYIGRFLGQPLPEDMGVVTLEITNLAEINRQHGHSAGDMAIQTFSEMLQNASGGVCFVGRNGGNKFVAIFRDCTEKKIGRFLSSIEMQEKKRTAEEGSYSIRYSSGVAFDEKEPVNSVTELVALSDRRSGSSAAEDQLRQR